MSQLVDKFKIKRHDQPYPKFGGKHFVLTPVSDVIARRAILTYALDMEGEGNNILALELRNWIDSIVEAENDIAHDAGHEAIAKLRKDSKL